MERRRRFLSSLMPLPTTLYMPCCYSMWKPPYLLGFEHHIIFWSRISHHLHHCLAFQPCIKLLGPGVGSWEKKDFTSSFSSHLICWMDMIFYSILICTYILITEGIGTRLGFFFKRVGRRYLFLYEFASSFYVYISCAWTATWRLIFCIGSIYFN